MLAGQPSIRHATEHGRLYAEDQHAAADASAQLNAWKFRDNIRPDDTVVDFGCGSGALLDLLPGSRKIGVEVNERARSYARLRGHETYASSADTPDAVADIVISNHALEHALNPHAELVELRRALRPGGRLVLWLPLDDWRVQRTLSLGLDKDHHLYAWTPRLIGNLLTESGFRVEAATVVTDAWPPRYSLVAFRLLPRPAFRALSYMTAVGLYRRQLQVLARKPSA
jgi:SAM-dependent methyltransferase